MKIINIAIDGPCGAGKSTIAKGLAKELGYEYLDTGAMYRALALKAHNNNIDVNDKDKVLPLLSGTQIDIDGQVVMLDGVDVSSDIRLHHMSKLASDISKIPEVRLHLVELQRQIAKKKNVVVDGRDIGSFVLKDANIKIYLTAKASERAKRRCAELISKGQEADFDVILKDVNDRDFNDMNRAFAPLVQCDDAIEVDSTDMTIDEVVSAIMLEVEKNVL